MIFCDENGHSNISEKRAVQHAGKHNFDETRMARICEPLPV